MNKIADFRLSNERAIFLINEAAGWLVRPIFEMLQQYHQPECPEPIRAHYRTVMRWIARDLENFVMPMVSAAAQERAFQMGVPDLRQFRWNDQKSRMKDPNREIFHWEHYTPVSNIVSALIGITTPNLDSIAEVLKTARVAWILKDENARLSHRSRKDPAADYARAGITLLC